MPKKTGNSTGIDIHENIGDGIELIIEGLPNVNSSEEKTSYPKHQTNSDTPLNFILVTIFIDILIGVSANIATNALPNGLVSFTWLAWPILALLIMVYLFLVSRSAKKDEQGKAKFQQNKLAKQAVKRVSPKRSLIYRIHEFFLGLASRRYVQKYEKMISKVLTHLEEYSEAINCIQLAQENGEVSKVVAERAKENLRTRLWPKKSVGLPHLFVLTGEVRSRVDEKKRLI